jgi:hypothetical protein
MKGKILQAGQVFIQETTVSVRQSSADEWEGWFVIPTDVHVVPESDFAIELDDNRAASIRVLSVSVAAPVRCETQVLEFVSRGKNSEKRTLAS